VSSGDAGRIDGGRFRRDGIFDVDDDEPRVHSRVRLDRRYDERDGRLGPQHRDEPGAATHRTERDERRERSGDVSVDDPWSVQLRDHGERLRAHHQRFAQQHGHWHVERRRQPQPSSLEHDVEDACGFFGKSLAEHRSEQHRSEQHRPEHHLTEQHGTEQRGAEQPCFQQHLT